MLTAESSDLWGFTKHPRGIVFGHIGHAENLFAVFIVEDDQIFVGPEIIFYLQFTGAREVAIRVDSFYLDSSFPGEFVFFEQVLEVVIKFGAGTLRSWSKENVDFDVFFKGSQKFLRQFGKGVFVIAGKIPAPVSVKSEVINHQNDHRKNNGLEDHVSADPQSFDAGWFGRWIRHAASEMVYTFQRRYWNIW